MSVARQVSRGTSRSVSLTLTTSPRRRKRVRDLVMVTLVIPAMSARWRCVRFMSSRERVVPLLLIRPKRPPIQCSKRNSRASAGLTR